MAKQKGAEVLGVKQIVGRLHTAKGETAKAMERALMKAGLFLQAESQKIVPVDTGALKNSAFTRKTGSGFQTSVLVGYTMFYAVYVHENLEARHAPGKVAKFLEEPARRFRARMMEIIRKEAQLKGGRS